MEGQGRGKCPAPEGSFAVSLTNSRAGSCELSVVIKALNEAQNIGRCLRAALHATEGLNAEIVLADSLSTDATVEIAQQFPVTVVQLANADDRSCGVGAQLGYQHAQGEYILVVDGDMEIERSWLWAAMAQMREAQGLAGLGGLVDDVNLDNIEFRARKQRNPPNMQAGFVDRLDGGGLYRRSAIEQVGYLTHPALHSREELELGLRLTQSGWQLARLDEVAVRHHGHTLPMWTLVKRRWRSRYVNGAGELIRASIGRSWFWRALACFRLSIAVLAWWVTMALAVVVCILSDWVPWYAPALLAAFPFIAMVIKKRSLALGMYSVMAWCIDAAGLLRGLLAKQRSPLAPIASRVRHSKRR
jgi:glycosyltransferase involved in cell wall biosynthesis